jgi:hypothetical protein
MENNRINKEKKSIKLQNIIKEYEQKQNNFDPSKPSPNLFIKKLEIRMKRYYHDLYNSYN